MEKKKAVLIRMPVELEKWLTKLAKENVRSLSAQIVKMLLDCRKNL